MIFDLDPDSPGDFALVRRTARELGDVLREAGVEPFAMTTGSKGIHVVVALQRRYSFGAVRDAAVAVAEELVRRRPKDLTLEFYKRKRGGRLFVDVNRNAYAATAVPPYGVRPLPGAPVATPLAWDELSDRRLRAQRWTIRTVLDRDPDVWSAIRGAARRVDRGRADDELGQALGGRAGAAGAQLCSSGGRLLDGRAVGLVGVGVDLVERLERGDGGEKGGWTGASF